MKRILKYILVAAMFLAVAFCVMLSYRAGKEAERGIICRHLDVYVADSSKNNFIRVNDIRTLLGREYGRYLGKPVDSLDLCRIEEIVDGKSAVLKSQVYVTCDSTLHIDIIQRRPYVRFQKENGGFYADKDGFLFPLQQRFSSYVPIVDGAIPIHEDFSFKGKASNPEEQKWIDGIIALVRYINSQSQWKGNITQIHIEKDGDIVLVPRAGKEKFNIGNITGLEDKFKKIEKYYKAIAPAKDEGWYSYINVKFDGQIICKQ